MGQVLQVMRSYYSSYFEGQVQDVTLQAVLVKRDQPAKLIRDIEIEGFGDEELVYVIPIRQVLQKLFAIPGLLDAMSWWGDFEQTGLWQNAVRNRFHANPASYRFPIAFFPINLHYGEFESGDALGSRSKFGVVYYSLPFLHPMFATKFKPMLAAVFRAQIREIEGNRAVFAPVIDELNFLYDTGITVKLENGEKRVVQFGLGCVVGDVLGLNSVLGLTSECCRVCRLPKDQYRTVYTDRAIEKRTTASFADDFALGNPSVTGVVEPWVWDDVPLQLETNCAVDIMEDLYEIARHVMTMVLKGLILKNNVFSLSVLNNRIKNLDYGPDSSTKPRPIPLAPQGFAIKQSLPQLRTFIAYFGLMIGHLVHMQDLGPDDFHNPERGRQPGDAEDFYKLYMSMNGIIREVDTTHLKFLRPLELSDKIEIFLGIFHRLSPITAQIAPAKDDDREALSLEPKLHFLIHLPSFMAKFGPLRNLSTVSFESQNKRNQRGLKNSFANVSSPYAAAKEQQDSLNSLFTKYTPPLQVDKPGRRSPITDDDISELISTFQLDPTCLLSIQSVITEDDTKFAPGHVVTLAWGDLDPVFTKIVSMYFDDKTKQTYFKGENLEPQFFCEHYQAYHVRPDGTSSFYKLSHRLERFPNTLIISLENNQWYVVYRNP